MSGKRRLPNRAKKRFLLFVEGETEKAYCEAARRHYRDRQVPILIESVESNPWKLVTEASKVRSSANPADEVWCVFDRDEHPSFLDSLDLASRKGVNVAVSIPCLELWFLLHVRDQHAYVDRKAVQKASRDALDYSGKIPTVQILESLFVDEIYQDARRRALELERRHKRDLSDSREANPQSDVYRLVDAIRSSRTGP